MSLLDRYERQAVMLRSGKRYEPITDVASEWSSEFLPDVETLMHAEARRWKEIDRNIREGWEPSALQGGLAGVVGQVPIASTAAVTGGTANVAIWNGLAFTPIPEWTRAESMYELQAMGVVTSSAASQTVTLNPHISTGAVGTNLTPSSAQTLGSTITNAVWQIDALITVRASGTGTNAIAWGGFRFNYTVLANVGAPTTVMWRTTANATFDSTAAGNQLVFGETPSAAGVSISMEQVRWGSWN